MTSTNNPFAADTLLLIGHGSPDPEGNAEYHQFTQIVSQRLDMPVQPCFLEIVEPSISAGIRASVEAGAQRIVALPLFLGPARHQKNDVPAVITHARHHWPQIEIRYGTPIGSQYPVVGTLAERATAALAQCTQTIPASATALLVVARGSRDPDSNSEVFKIARLLWEGRNYGWVEAAFQSVTPPNVVQGIERCVQLGAQRVVVVPYVLFTGFVHKDIMAQAATAQTRYPQVEILMAGHLNNHSGVIEAVAERYHEVVAGTATMNCDVCIYRYRVPGFEQKHGMPLAAHEHHHHAHADPPHVHEHPHTDHNHD